MVQKIMKGGLLGRVFVLLLFLFLCSAMVLVSATQTVNPPSTCNGRWSSCSNAFADDSNRATGSVNYNHVWRNYGFSLPSSSTIQEVIVRSDFFASKTNGYIDVKVSKDGGNSYGAAHRVGGNTAEQTFWINVTNDLSWNADGLNNNNFRVNVTCIKDGSGSSPKCNLDYIPVRVTYVEAPAPDTTPPASVTNLNNQSEGTTWLYWTWTNPSNPDFFQNIIYVDGIWNVNTSNAFYNKTGLSPNTVHTITVHTKDTSGNVNNTDVNNTARTEPEPDTTPPHSVTNLDNQSQTTTSIYWTWTNPNDPDFFQNIIYLDGIWRLNTSNNFWNATNLNPDTLYTITVHTKDTDGNVNNTDVNDTARTNATPPPPDTTPPASVTNLNNQSEGTTWIYWTWTNPSNPDFFQNIIYVDGIWNVNTSNAFYNKTGLSPNTVHTITVHTKDTSGNVNNTDVNNTARTEPEPDTTPPHSVTNLDNQSQTTTSIYWTWTNPNDPDFFQNIIYLDGIWRLNTSNNFWNATNLNPNTPYTITVHTKDTSGNVNNTDVNDTARTNANPPPPPQPPPSGFVYTNGTALMLNGENFTFIGANSFGAANDFFLGICGPGNDYGHHPDEYLESMFANLSKRGVNSMRFWAFQQFTANGTNFTGINRVIQKAKKYDMKVIPVLENQWESCTQGGYKNNSWYKEGYKNPYGNYALPYKVYVQRIVGNFSNETTIMLWQMMNEAESKNISANESDHQSLYNFSREMSGFIKSIDNNHLVSLGTIGTGQPGIENDVHNPTNDKYKKIHNISTIDICEAHDYTHPEQPWPNPDNPWSSINTSYVRCRELNKPFFIGEAGIRDNSCNSPHNSNPEDTNCYNQTRRAELFDAKMGTAFQNKSVSGYLVWQWDNLNNTVEYGASCNSNSYDDYCFTHGDPLLDVIEKHSPVKKLKAPPPNFKVAFIGDSGYSADGQKFDRVLNLIRDEGAEMVIHMGDLGYVTANPQSPELWENDINNILDPWWRETHPTELFPYFFSMGNHDKEYSICNGVNLSQWTQTQQGNGCRGYREILKNRLQNHSIVYNGTEDELGTKTSFAYQKLFVVLTAPAETCSFCGGSSSEKAAFIDEQLRNDYIWDISAWHRLMEFMQTGDHGNATGWDVYERSRDHGAIIATAHTHSYARTYVLDNMSDQNVVDNIDPFTIKANFSSTKGQTIAFHSGLGGKSIDEQFRCFPTTKPYGCKGEWAEIYSKNQSANYGALFIEFNVDGDPRKARGYFKNIDNGTLDNFTLYNNPPPDTAPPHSVTNLNNQSEGTTWLYWNWTNPSDPDFFQNIIYVDGIWEGNTSNSFYNKTGLSPNTEHTITVHTKDTSGNVNNADVNNTARTEQGSSPPDTTPPHSITNLDNQSQTTTSIYWNWTNPSDPDFSQNIIYLDSVWKINTSNNFWNATNLNSNTSYTITVHTKDTSGNINNTDVNDTAKTLANPPSGSTEIKIYNPIADSFTRMKYPTNNYGSATLLQVDYPSGDNNNDTAYLKFNLTDIGGRTVYSAKLRVYVTNSGADKNVKKISDDSWTEMGINWNNAQGPGDLVQSFNGVLNQWAEIDVLSYVDEEKGQLMSMAIDTQNSDGMDLHSRENTNKPELVVNVTTS